jgi:hypothetical protein
MRRPDRKQTALIRSISAAGFLFLLLLPAAFAQKSTWRQATDAELAALLPARAPVEKEHIETEMRTATGITNGKGRFIAGVVLITAGYSAEGKYSHYLMVQAPMHVGSINLAPGEYVLGFERSHNGNGLDVHFNEALSGKLVGSVEAHEMAGKTGVASLRIWPPGEKPVIQIGRFVIPYDLGEE